MSEITKCLNEWNATIESLGQGKQTILIRKYDTTLTEFLLYPTISYANKDDVLDSFQEDYQEFVKDNLLPKGENRKYEMLKQQFDAYKNKNSNSDCEWQD